MELLEIVFVREKSNPRSCWNFEALFSLKLAINPIDFYSLLWHTLKGWIRGLYIEYKSNSSPIHGLLGLLVQVGEGKLFPFLILPYCQLLPCNYARSHLDLSSSLSWGELERNAIWGLCSSFLISSQAWCFG